MPAGILPATMDDAWFARDTLAVARDLVGAVLEVGPLAARITEVEAYTDDAASHFVTRPRTASMMGTTHGRIYVYRIYGMHRCLNVTTDASGPGAVLFRALEPIRGADEMFRRRGVSPARNPASGPANLFVALGLDDSLLGRRFLDVFRLTPAADPVDVVTGPRVGISRAKDLPWRFRLGTVLGIPRNSGFAAAQARNPERRRIPRTVPERSPESGANPEDRP